MKTHTNLLCVWEKSLCRIHRFLSFHLVLIQLSSSHCSLCLLPLAYFLPDQYEKGLRQRNERSEMVAVCLRAAVKLGLGRFSDLRWQSNGGQPDRDGLLRATYAGDDGTKAWILWFYLLPNRILIAQ
jgi:hypothetical protein